MVYRVRVDHTGIHELSEAEEEEQEEEQGQGGSDRDGDEEEEEERLAGYGTEDEEEEEEEDDDEPPPEMVERRQSPRRRQSVRSSPDFDQPHEVDAFLANNPIEMDPQQLLPHYSPQIQETIDVPASVWSLTDAVEKDPANKFWICKHCNTHFKGVPHATKAKAHLAKISGHSYCASMVEYPSVTGKRITESTLPNWTGVKKKSSTWLGDAGMTTIQTMKTKTNTLKTS
jgi:hypothetical protein